MSDKAHRREESERDQRARRELAERSRLMRYVADQQLRYRRAIEEHEAVFGTEEDDERTALLRSMGALERRPPRPREP